MRIPLPLALVLFGLLPFALSTPEEVAETGFGKDLAEDARFEIRILSFNILQGGNHAPAIGFPDAAFGGSRKNEVAKPGNTWTPPYKTGLPGRCAYENQVLDRIDRVHFAGPGLRVTAAAVVGESRQTCEIVHDGPWVSDHRAVLGTFELTGVTE